MICAFPSTNPITWEETINIQIDRLPIKTAVAKSSGKITSCRSNYDEKSGPIQAHLQQAWEIKTYPLITRKTTLQWGRGYLHIIIDTASLLLKSPIG